MKKNKKIPNHRTYEKSRLQINYSRVLFMTKANKIKHLCNCKENYLGRSNDSYILHL